MATRARTWGSAKKTFSRRHYRYYYSLKIYKNGRRSGEQMGVTSRRRNARVVCVPYAAYSREMPHIWNKRAIQSCLSLETKSSDVFREDIADSTGKWRIFEKKVESGECCGNWSLWKAPKVKQSEGRAQLHRKTVNGSYGIKSDKENKERGKET